MAKDIWIHIEHRSRKKNKYVYDFEADGERIYALFGALAGARGAIAPLYEPRGLPNDVSPEVLEEYRLFEGDAHTPSWLNTEEFRRCLDLTITVLSKEEDEENVKTWLQAYEKIYEYMKYCDDEGEPSRMVFWFDN